MNFERLLLKAKEGNADAVLKILEIYKPLLIKVWAISFNHSQGSNILWE